MWRHLWIIPSESEESSYENVSDEVLLEWAPCFKRTQNDVIYEIEMWDLGLQVGENS